MKCIQYYPVNTKLGRVERIERTSDDEAARLVAEKKAIYVPRSAWKEKVRTPQRLAAFMGWAGQQKS